MPIPAAPIIAAIVAGFARLFASRIGQWVTAALVFMGIGLASHGVLVQPLLDQVQDIAQDAGSSTGSIAVQWLAFLNFDKAITMIFSAYAARAAVSAGKVWLAKR
jgi:hypothetical protein